VIHDTEAGRLNAAFLSLGQTLTSDYDVADFLHTLMVECVRLLDVQAAGLLLQSRQGELELVASTSQQARFVEVMQLNAGEGPCVECCRTGEAIEVEDVEHGAARWHEFRSAALREGFRSVRAVPLRVRSEVIGSMGLFRTRAGALDPMQADVALALANLASIGILHERVVRESSVVADQLQRALDSRVLIEQAKGVLAALTHADMDEAFEMLRRHARSTSTSLRDVSQRVVDRTLDLRAERGA
jgi:GAF domain-containing protein